MKIVMRKVEVALFWRTYKFSKNTLILFNPGYFFGSSAQKKAATVFRNTKRPRIDNSGEGVVKSTTTPARSDKHRQQQLPIQLIPKGNNLVHQFLSSTQAKKLSILEKLNTAGELKQLSILAREMSCQNEKSETLWMVIEKSLISSFKITTEKQKIRTYSKILYALGKSKKATQNYENLMALVLPFSSNQSFTQIVVSISRMGGMSEQFAHITQKLYWKRRSQFSALELNLINYVLVKNGKQLDTSLVQKIQHFPLRGIAIMLKAYDLSNNLTIDILKKASPAILARKSQTNILDLRDFLCIYLKYGYLQEDILNYFVVNYRYLARNVTEQILQQIWRFVPQALNGNKLPVELVQNLIKTVKVLKHKQKISSKVWQFLKDTFKRIQNLEVRTKLEKI